MAKKTIFAPHGPFYYGDIGFVWDGIDARGWRWHLVMAIRKPEAPRWPNLADRLRFLETGQEVDSLEYEDKPWFQILLPPGEPGREEYEAMVVNQYRDSRTISCGPADAGFWAVRTATNAW